MVEEKDVQPEEKEKIQAKLDKVIGEGKTPEKRYRLVDPKTSKSPILNVDLLKRKGKRVHIAEGIIADMPFRIGIRRGIPLEFQLMLNQTGDVFALQRDKTAKDENQTQAEKTGNDWRNIEQSNRQIREILVASTMVVINEDDEPLIDPETGQFIPLFSLNGVGGEMPIEEIDDLTLMDLYEATKEVQAPAAAAAVLNQFQESGRKRRTRRKKSGT